MRVISPPHALDMKTRGREIELLEILGQSHGEEGDSHHPMYTSPYPPKAGDLHSQLTLKSLGRMLLSKVTRGQSVPVAHPLHLPQK